MVMAAARVVELCAQNAYVLKEDLALMESGAIKIHVFGADATEEQAGRLRANLSRLQEIIGGCGCDCD